MNFNLSRALSIANKEIMHILRDPFTLIIALGLPIILVTFFGFAINFEIEDVKLNVSDLSQSRASRQLLEVFNASGYFNVVNPTDYGNLLKDVTAERVAGSIYIKPDFSKKINAGKTSEIQIILDGTDNSKAGTILTYLPGIEKAAIQKITGKTVKVPIKIHTRFLYNQELNSRWFMVPGITVLVIGLLSILLTALTISKEWENGSMELLLSTPIKPIEIILGKIVPYAIIVMIGVLFVYLVARFGFNIPFRGSHTLFIFVCFIYIVASLSQGVLISVLTRQQAIAMQFSIITGLLPSLLLSGFIFPIESMPKFFQYFVMVLSPRWFMTATRSIFLKGSSFFELLPSVGALSLLAFILLSLAILKFKTDMEP